MEANVMTQAGHAALEAEIEELETAGRAEIAAQIKTAREWGDLKENAEYHAAKNAQAHLETRIARLRERLATAQIVEESAPDGRAAFGSTVEVSDEQSGKSSTYKLVSARDAAPADGRLSYDSPVAIALRGLSAGDVAVVRTPTGERRLRVVSVS